MYDPDNPPESYVIVNMGTDTTDLVITNGFRVWQRNIPLGGNHFTKQLTKELKLTFTKAEHLKRHVREAEDAKAVIQAMRPVFNDLLTEVQRSIGFFQNIDRKAEIGGMITLGNAVKLPGLQQYLAKNLGYELIDVNHESWAGRLAGQSVLTAPQFKDNMHAFGVCYGLCLQGLGRGKLDTNLLPKELITERIIRAKKPWALAIAASLMLAFAVNFFFEYRDWYKVHPERDFDGKTWTQAMDAVEAVESKASADKSKDAQLVSRLDELVALGKELSGNTDRRLLWLELLKAINAALPNDGSPLAIPDPREEEIWKRQDIHIEYIESQYFPEPEGLAAWFTEPVKKKYLLELARLEGVDTEGIAAEAVSSSEEPVASAPAAPAAPADPAAPTAPTAPAAPADPAAATTPDGAEAADPAAVAAEGTEPPPEPTVDDSAEVAAAMDMADEIAAEAGLDPDSITGPEGPGWVIEIKGHHFFNKDIQTWGGTHVRNTFLKKLREQKVALPMGPGQPPMEFTMEELGVSYVILAAEPLIDKYHQIPNPFFEPETGPGGYGYGDSESSYGEGYGTPGYGTPGYGTPGYGTPGYGAAARPGTPPAEEEAEEPEGPPEPPFFDAPKFEFVVQFCWQEVQLAERLRQRRELLQQQQEAQGQPTEPQPTEPQPAPPTDGVAVTNVGE
jgi:type IV pilus assembly protein PilM